MELLGFCVHQQHTPEKPYYEYVAPGPLAQYFVGDCNNTGSKYSESKYNQILFHYASLGSTSYSENTISQHTTSLPIIELIFGLGMNCDGSTGRVDIPVGSVEERDFKRDVPVCMALEAVYMRYFAETHLHR
jgi:hypothetical protein